MAVIINVTPDEFSKIRFASESMPPADFAFFMREYFGCKYYESYKLNVLWSWEHSIPWVSAGLERFGEWIPKYGYGRYKKGD